MKIVELPTGKVMQFPDETDDAAIDTAVQRHMADHIAKTEQEEQKSIFEENEKRAKAEREDADRRYKLQRDEEIRQQDLARQNARRMREDGERKYDRDRSDKYRQEDKMQSAMERQEDMARHAHRDALINGIITQLDLIAKSVVELGEVKNSVSKMTQEIENLGNKVEFAISSAVAALTAPKTLIINKNGKPVGIKYMSDDNG